MFFSLFVQQLLHVLLLIRYLYVNDILQGEEEELSPYYLGICVEELTLVKSSSDTNNATVYLVDN